MIKEDIERIKNSKHKDFEKLDNLNLKHYDVNKIKEKLKETKEKELNLEMEKKKLNPKDLEKLNNLNLKHFDVNIIKEKFKEAIDKEFNNKMEKKKLNEIESNEMLKQCQIRKQRLKKLKKIKEKNVKEKLKKT